MNEQTVMVVSVKWLRDYKLEINFSDTTSQIIDFSSFIINSKHPDINQYQDISRFKKYTITNGDLEWNDYELCFSIEDLYQNKNIESVNISHAA